MTSPEPGTSASTHVLPPGASRSRQARRERFVAIAMCVLATVQVACFYVICVPEYLFLSRYEAGTERMPFQGRMLMRFPLRWAHGSVTLQHVAKFLESLFLTKQTPVLAEDVVEILIDSVAIAVAGLVARSLYQKFSKTQRFSALVYPLVLVMVTASYCLLSSHYFRFVYDMLSLALFAAGLFLIARRSNVFWFMALFVVATINRETSIFLLYLFLASAVVEGQRISWRRLLKVSTGGVAGLLAIFWVGWHVWLERHFAGSPTEAGHHVGVNLLTLVWPLMWPQLFAVAAYMVPVLLIFRCGPRPLELRLWMWVFPAWAVFMFIFGIVFEIRIFGELIPLLACLTMLLSDERFGAGLTPAEVGANATRG